MTRHHKFLSTTSALLCLCALFAFIPACNRAKPPLGSANSQSGVKRYALKGTVVSVDKNAGNANIDNEPVAGFMDKMVMSYPLKPATAVVSRRRLAALRCARRHRRRLPFRQLSS